MVGLLAGAEQEAVTGHTFLYQLQHLSPSTVFVVVLWTVASMVPILHGAKNEPFGGW